MRHVQLELGPSPALVALTELGRALDDRWVLGSALARAAQAERQRLRAPLDVLAGCLEWLEAQGHAAIVRPRATRAERIAAYLVTVRIDLDVRALVRGVADEGRAPRGPWHVTAFALTSVLRALCERSLLVARVLRADKRAVDARVVLEAIDAALGGASANAGASAKKARTGKARPAARARPVKKRVEKKVRANERVEHKAKARRGASATKPPPRARRGAGSGFGGLPDDAEPEPRAAEGRAAIGPRGISMDAEFFLEHAGVATWPCTAGELTVGRRRALAGLHPDRVGESGTLLFQRAVRGHAELVRRLESLGNSPPIAAAAPARPGPREARVAPPAAAPASAAVGQWPSAKSR